MKLPHVSASQVTLFERCPRKWFWRYVEGIKFPPSAAMLRGTDIHTGIERWLVHMLGPEKALAWTAMYIDAIKQAKHKGELVLPDPADENESFLVEEPITIETPGLPKFIGFIDLLWLSKKPLPRVLDTKTTSDLRYAKTPAELEKNIQLNAYAKWCHVEDLRGPLEIGHAYIEVRKNPPKKALPRVRYVPVIRTEDQVEEVWQGILETVNDMQQLAYKLDSALDCEPNTAACDDYGGCEYRGHCGISDLPITGSFAKKKPKTEEIVTVNKFKEMLAKRKAEKEAEEKARASAATEAVAPAETEPEPETKPVSKGAPWNKKKAEPAEAKVPEGIEPPDGAPRDSLAEPEAAAEKPKAKKRGRPKGSKNKAKTAKAEASETKPAKPAKKAKGGFKLYIDCLPTKGVAEPVLYEDWITAVEEICNEQAQAKEDGAKPNYRMLPYHEPKILFKQVLEAQVQSGLPEVLVMSSHVSFAGEALSVLIPHASEVVRAW
jgi:RecB family exonuclease